MLLLAWHITVLEMALPASALCDLDTFLGPFVPASSSVKCGLLQGWPELMNRNAVLRSTCRWPESVTRHQLLLLVAAKGLLWVRAWSSFIQTHLQLSSCVQKGLFQSRARAAAHWYSPGMHKAPGLQACCYAICVIWGTWALQRCLLQHCKGQVMPSLEAKSFF